jgi:hypothetical protein
MDSIRGVPAPQCLNERSDRVQILEALDRNRKFFNEACTLQFHVAREKGAQCRVQLKQTSIKGRRNVVGNGLDLRKARLYEPAAVAR